VVYVGDGVPSVGELAPKVLSERLARLPAGTRLLAAAVGSQPNLPLLASIVRGAPVEQVSDAYGAARSSLRLLEAAGRSSWLGAKVDLGPAVERVLPRVLPPITADETTMIVGRVTGAALPRMLELSSSEGSVKQRLSVRHLRDYGDLRRRWAEERFDELRESGAGRASLVDIGRRFGLVTPFTSLYVPTRREREQEHEAQPDVVSIEARREERARRWRPWWNRAGEASAAPALSITPAASEVSDNKEGGTGTRAKGVKVPTGIPVTSAEDRRYAAQEAKDNDAPAAAHAAALKEAENFSLNGPSSGSSAVLREVEVAARDEGLAQLEMQPLGALSSTGPAHEASAAAAKPRAANRPLRPSMAVHGLSGVGTTGDLALGGGPAHLGAGGGADGTPKVTGLPVRPSNVSKTLKVAVTSSIGSINHERAPCGRGADLPLSERLLLWRERLGSGLSVDMALHVYRTALAECEASDWRERSALLVQIVDHLGSIAGRVALWRALLAVSPTAADAVYRFMLLRVQTSQDLKELHEALGLSQIEPQLLDALLKKAKNAAERLALLRGAAEKFANDTELSLLVLDAYEDAGDEAGGRAWARKLRRRADASSHVRTNVGEYYLRLSGRGKGAQVERDAEEARRTFGELVEFAPEDPLSRRRLGDLLRAHGWYEEALRQYETLAALTPDDPSVPLLLAAANQGTGKVEEAVRWAEKAAATGSPDGESQMALAARALASAFLCWARQDSARAGNTAEVERLRGRAARLAASGQGQGVRIILSWAHPELRPALWSNALGSMMPAPDNLPLLGVAQVFVPGSPTPEIELRLDTEDAARAARLELKATLTALVAEGTPEERLARLEVAFKGEAGKPLDRVRLRFEDGRLVEVP